MKKGTRSAGPERHDPTPLEADRGASPEIEAGGDLGEDFPIVGIGASAGGLAAFESFFSGMPADAHPNMAFVLVQHLAPGHKSILAELISRHTSMEVVEVQDGMVVKPDCAYIIPPGHDMALVDGALRLSAPSAPQGPRLSVDLFFRSLAKELKERAICIVLSGTGSDGTLGLRAVKGEGGMAMVQSPDTTTFDGMPRNAIATGLADYVLPPAEMPAQLFAYAAYAFGKPRHDRVGNSEDNDDSLERILALLRTQTGHEFRTYKPSSVRRRIERRMAVNRLGTMGDYLGYLERTPGEGEFLFRDLLIGVTGFFRDTEAFKALSEQVIPRLFDARSAGATIRVWLPGCSTGEEAYSVAILLQEQREALKRDQAVQIFASDIDSRAIAAARSGVYPASISADLSPERLSRFFILEPGGNAYRVNKTIRDMLVFSEQDVTRDPPFSRLDLVCCRNLLIYLDAGSQDRLLSLFHYALNPGGFLFLGSSETAGESGELFVAVDRKARLYQREERVPGLRPSRPDRNRHAMTRPEALSTVAGKAFLPERLSLRELTEQAVLRQIVPAAALVDGRGDILYLHGRTGPFLEPAPGVSGVNNILAMAREGLRQELAVALGKAASTKEAVRCPCVRVGAGKDSAMVNLTVCTVSVMPAGSATALFLVVMDAVPDFDPVTASRMPPGGDASIDPDRRIEMLSNELRAKEQYLRIFNDELETTNEELMSANEELQSVNEELQSTNEELETSKEELQSANEELITVNGELQSKVTELHRANNDMSNLLAGTGIGTVFVDHGMRVLRFTLAVIVILNLIPGDIGRPVNHIVSNIVGYDRLVEDTQAVLDSLIPRELEVATSEGRWYTMRILPYRTLDNVIEGAVINFVDITEKRRAQEALAVSEIRYRRLFETAKNGILILDAENGMIAEANPFLSEMLGYSIDELAGKAIWDIGPFKDVAANREHFLKLQQQEYIRYEDLPLETADGRQIEVEFISNVYTVDHRKVIQCDIRDITDRKRADREIAKLVEERELLLKEVHHRIKNNMSIIRSLLSIQADALKGTPASVALEDAESRVQSMMVLYDKLYRSDSFSVLSVKDYLSTLVDEIMANFPERGEIEVRKEIGDFAMDVNRLQPLGIIVNELLTNIMKYAFAGRRGGLITISMSSDGPATTLAIQDDGNGMPPSIDFSHSTGFGLTLVEMLTKQLDGRIRIERGDGTRVVLEF